MKHLIIINSLILTLMTSAALAQSTDSVSNAEVETYLQSYVGKQIDKSILGSESFKNCFEQGQAEFDNSPPGASLATKFQKRNETIRNCNTSKFGTLQDEEIKALADEFKLESFDKNAAKSATSIRAYLSKRLEEAIYGVQRGSDGKLTKLSERTYTDHENFYQLYLEQIGKNTLLLASQYCLENFGYKTKNTLVQVDPNNSNQIYIIEGGITKNGDIYSTTKNLSIGGAVGKSTTISVDDFWKKKTSLLKEYEVCSSQDCDNNPGILPELDSNGKFKSTPDSNKLDGQNNIISESVNKRSVALITALKNASFELAANDAQAIASNYRFCAAQVIQNMCEVYRCNNIYSDTDNKETKECIDKYDIKVKASQTNPSPELVLGSANADKAKGQVACNLMEQIRSYRKALLATKEIQNELSLPQTGKTIIQGMGIKKYENSGDTSIDSLTSISSTELTEEVGDIASSAERAEELKELCLETTAAGQVKLKDNADQNNECKEIMAQLTAEDIANITADSEVQTALLVKRLDGLQNSSADELKKFLEENNLNEYLSKLEGEGGEATLSEKDLVALIKNDFLTKKNAELDAIKQRFNTEMKIAGGDQSDPSSELAADEVASETISDIEQHKQRVQTLFQYSNVVSSYLEITGGDQSAGTTAQTANVTGRRLEIADSNNPDDTKLLDYFSEGSEQTSSKNNTFDYNQVFDAILGDVPASNASPTD